jgi:hypothetical protein
MYFTFCRKHEEKIERYSKRHMVTGLTSHVKSRRFSLHINFLEENGEYFFDRAYKYPYRMKIFM